MLYYQCNLFHWTGAALGTMHEEDSNLSWVEGLHCFPLLGGLLCIPLHEEHVNEVDENTRGQFGVLCGEGQPFVEYHEHQVAKQTQQEQEFRQKYQVEVVPLPKVPVFIWGKKRRKAD